MTFSPPQRDILEITADQGSLQHFENSRILVSGATGFVGTWLSQSLIHASSKYKLGLQVFQLSRNGTPIKGSKDSYCIKHDIRLPLPSNLPEFDYVFHTATPSQPATGGIDTKLVYETTVQGTKNLLLHLSKQKISPVFLHTSSGAVDRLNSLVAETELQETYRKGKEAAEKLVEDFSRQGNVIGANPRLYTFAGPGIATDAHFAAGQFMRSALSGNPLMVLGNPNTKRSYMYPTDLTSWIIEISRSPTLERIRIGNPDSITISELASLVTSVVNFEDKSYSGDESLPENYYVPDLTETLDKFPLKVKVSTRESFERWKSYLLEISNHGGVGR